MLYVKCPSCKTLLADKQLTYDDILEKICGDLDTGKITAKQADELKKKLVNSFDLKYCCKMRLMTFARLINVVK